MVTAFEQTRSVLEELLEKGGGLIVLSCCSSQLLGVTGAPDEAAQVLFLSRARTELFEDSALSLPKRTVHSALTAGLYL